MVQNLRTVPTLPEWSTRPGVRVLNANTMPYSFGFSHSERTLSSGAVGPRQAERNVSELQVSCRSLVWVVVPCWVNPI